jgi:hypothetical protein
VVARVVGPPDGERRARRRARSTRRSGRRRGRARARRPATPAPRSPAAATTDFSPNAPGARSGLAGSVQCSCSPSARCTASAYSKRPSAGAGIRSVQPSPSRTKGSAGTGKPRSVASRHAGERLVGSERRRTIESPSTSGPVAAIGDDTGRQASALRSPRGPLALRRAPRTMKRCLRHVPPAHRRPDRRARLRRPAPAHRPDLRPAGEHEGGLTKLTGPRAGAPTRSARSTPSSSRTTTTPTTSTPAAAPSCRAPAAR